MSDIPSYGLTKALELEGAEGGGDEGPSRTWGQRCEAILKAQQAPAVLSARQEATVPPPIITAQLLQ